MTETRLQRASHPAGSLPYRQPIVSRSDHRDLSMTESIRIELNLPVIANYLPYVEANAAGDEQVFSASAVQK